MRPRLRARSLRVPRYPVIASAAVLGVLASGWVLLWNLELSLSVLALSSRATMATALASALSPFPSITLGGTRGALPTETPAGFSLAVVTHIPVAREIVQTEQEHTAAERDAFAQFGQRVATLDPPSSAGDNSQSQGQGQTPPRTMTPRLNPSTSPTTDGVDEIQQAYREIVMGMDHYEQEYDEPLGVNLAAEFSEELAVAITNNPQLTPHLQQTVVQAATAASARREEFIARLDEEHATLDEAYQTLATISEQYERVTERPRYQQSAVDLQETHQQLTDCCSACEQLLDERQTQRAEGHTAEPRIDELVDLHHYLYQSLDVTYPVLADGTTLLDRCQTACRRVEDDLGYRLSTD